MNRPTIGLALSGGGARGMAHLGFLKVFEEAGIPIDYIAGASMGGLIAAAYACGVPLSVIEEKALQLSRPRELFRLLDLSRERRGLFEGHRLRDFLADMFLERHFENTRIPLAITCVDIVESREVVFTSGLIFPAVMGTITVPGLFQPVEIGPYRLVDGGVLNNLPVNRVRELGADIIIAVDVQLNPLREKPWQDLPEKPHFPVPLPGFFLDFYRAELIMIAQLTKLQLEKCPADLLLCPEIASDIDMFLGFPRIPEAIAAGEACARQALPQIQKLMVDAFTHQQQVQPKNN
jgi:NTE family protein